MDPSATAFLTQKGELILQLDRFIYGLKQSPYKFQLNLKGFLEGEGYQQQPLDECLYMKKVGSDWSIISTHVDDILQTATTDRMIKELQTALDKRYGKTTYSPEAQAYIGLSLERSKDLSRFKLTQRGLTDKILTDFCANDMRISKDPAISDLFTTSSNIVGEGAKPVDMKKYLSLVMSLMYLARLTRPDILLPVTYLATRSHHCNQNDWKQAIKICHYLRNTATHGIVIDCQSLDINCICDASYGVHPDGKSHTGYAITFGTNSSFVHTKSAKQKLVAQSSTDAEVFAMVDCLKQASWMRELIQELALTDLKKLTIYQDNKSAIIMTTDTSKFRKSKHILTKISYARQMHMRGILSVTYLDTNSMFADMLTKPLHGDKFIDFCDSIMGVQNWDSVKATMINRVLPPNRTLTVQQIALGQHQRLKQT